MFVKCFVEVKLFISFFITIYIIHSLSTKLSYNIYFRLRFGLVNEINTYLRIRIRFVYGGNFLP